MYGFRMIKLWQQVKKSASSEKGGKAQEVELQLEISKF